MKVTVEIFIGDIKEDQIDVYFKHSMDIELLREIKRNQNKLIYNKIDSGEWRMPNFAGEFAVSLKLSCQSLQKEEIQRIEHLANSIY